MKNWENILVRETDTILVVLSILEKWGTQFVAVVDSKGKLLGSVTDGDIRRGLLSGIQVSQQIHEVMNKSPKYLHINASTQTIQNLMLEKNLNHLPLVNDLHLVCGVASLKSFDKMEKKENHVILMAGGMGSRLAALTADCPKPMLKIGGSPILKTIIDTFKQQGFYKFKIAVNYKSELIESYFKDGKELGIEIEYLKEKTKLGTAGALSLYPSNGLPFIVMNGDLLTKMNFNDLLTSHLKTKHSVTMGLRQYEHQIPFGVAVTENDLVVQIKEKPIHRYFVSGGIYVLNPEVLNHVPADSYLDMPDLIDILISKNKNIGAYPFHEYWIDIGRMDDYERAHADFLGIFK